MRRGSGHGIASLALSRRVPAVSFLAPAAPPGPCFARAAPRSHRSTRLLLSGLVLNAFFSAVILISFARRANPIHRRPALDDGNGVRRDLDGCDRADVAPVVAMTILAFMAKTCDSWRLAKKTRGRAAWKWSD